MLVTKILFCIQLFYLNFFFFTQCFHFLENYLFYLLIRFSGLHQQVVEYFSPFFLLGKKCERKVFKNDAGENESGYPWLQRKDFSFSFYEFRSCVKNSQGEFWCHYWAAMKPLDKSKKQYKKKKKISPLI